MQTHEQQAKAKAYVNIIKKFEGRECIISGKENGSPLGRTLTGEYTVSGDLKWGSISVHLPEAFTLHFKTETLVVDEYDWQGLVKFSDGNNSLTIQTVEEVTTVL